MSFLPPTTCHPKSNQGFTLIELLVVIGIIGLLSTIVVATLSSVRESARLTGAKHAASTMDNDIGSEAVGWWDFSECAGSTARDSAAGSNSTLFGAASWSASVPTGTGCSLFLNGTNSYVLGASNLDISGDASFTMCAWIKWTGSSWDSNFPSFMGNDSTGVTNQGLSFTVSAGRPAVDFWVNRFRVNNALNVNTWYYLCGAKSPGVISANTKIYVDGIRVAGAVEGADTVPNITDSPAVIGRLDATRWFNGLVDGVRFYSATLTASEVQKIYAMEKSAHEDALAAGN